MIVIDENVYVRLTKYLEATRQDADDLRCIHFNISAQANKDELFKLSRGKIVLMIENHLGQENHHLYFCEDGDIFIIGSNIGAKPAHNLMIEFAGILGAKADYDFANLYQLATNISKLLFIIEQKITKKRIALELQKKLAEEKQAELKRYEILDSSIVAQKAKDLNARRMARQKPEFMIIEDDAFSRKLLENVLQKQFSLTQLGTADLALAMYANVAPDILFLDINLPDVTGHELLEKIMQIDPNAYVIMLSGNSDKDNIMQAMQNGAKGFVAKPFNRDRIFQYIDRCPSLKKQKEGVI